MHVGVYMLYLIGLLYFYFVSMRHIGSVTQNQFLLQISIKIGLSCLSQVALSYLFYVLCVNTTTKSRAHSGVTNSVNGRNSNLITEERASTVNVERESNIDFSTIIDVSINEIADDFDDEDMTDQERFFQKAILHNLI